MEQNSRNLHQVGDSDNNSFIKSGSRRMSNSLYIIDWSKSIGRHHKKQAIEIQEADSSSSDSVSSEDEREETITQTDSPGLLCTVASPPPTNSKEPTYHFS